MSTFVCFWHADEEIRNLTSGWVTQRTASEFDSGQDFWLGHSWFCFSPSHSEVNSVLDRRSAAEPKAHFSWRSQTDSGTFAFRTFFGREHKSWFHFPTTSPPGTRGRKTATGYHTVTAIFYTILSFSEMLSTFARAKETRTSPTV